MARRVSFTPFRLLLSRSSPLLPRSGATVGRAPSLSATVSRANTRAYTYAAALDYAIPRSPPPPPPPPPKRSRIRRFFAFGVRAAFYAGLGFALVIGPPAVSEVADFVAVQAKFREDGGYVPPDDRPDARAAEAYLDAHPLVRQLRAHPGYYPEQRPSLLMPRFMRTNNLTAATLAGPDLLTVPPILWHARPGGRSLVAVAHLGPGLCGHPGIVHGGFVATLLDEAFAHCCFDALPMKGGVTRYLHIDYRAPTPASAFVVVRAETTRVDGRKAWVRGRLETLPPPEGGEPVLLAEAEALFVGYRDHTGVGKIIPPSVHR